MASHNETGKDGEDLAANWLTKNGFEIIHRNWRFAYYEIDIVARKGKYLCFIEVKTRKNPYFGYPEDSVTKKKFRNLQKAADQYLFLNPGNPWIQFHILSITFQVGGEAQFYLIEDVYL